MNTSKMLLIIFSILVSFLPNIILSEEKIITAISDDWPPFVDNTDSNGGLSLAIIRASYKTQGYIVKLMIAPWSRAEELVSSGTYDILPNVWITDKRKEKMLFSKAYAINSIKFIKKAGDPFEFKNIESLRGKSIGVIRHYGYSDEFNNSKDFTKYEDIDLISNIKKLCLPWKVITLTLEDETVAKYILTRHAPTLLQEIEFSKIPLSENGLYISASFLNPRHRELINGFNSGLKEIKLSGELEKIFSSYGVKYKHLK